MIGQLDVRERMLWWSCVAMLATLLGWTALIGAVVALAPPSAIASSVVVVRALGHVVVALTGCGWPVLPLFAPHAWTGPAGAVVVATMTRLAAVVLAEVHRG